MKNTRREIKNFLAACERFFAFANESGPLTPDECRVLYYYAEELRKQIAPACSESGHAITLEDKRLNT